MPMVESKNEHPKHIKRPSENDFLHTQVKHAPQSQPQFSYEALQESAQYLLDRTTIRPRIGIICGSGLGPIVDTLTQKQVFPYEEIPHFPSSTVKGHVGQMVFGYLQGVPVMCMQGRFHYYEGYPLWKCAMPVRVMKLVGATHLIVTNAAGGINPNFKVGDIMLMKDHVNMMGFAGNSPLQGPNDDRFGPRFPPMNQAYDKQLLAIADKVVAEMGIQNIVRRGVYTCIGGPNYETVAEFKILQILGIDAVGMSTVHEVITARHCNMKVFAFSLITNMATSNYEDHTEADHKEVMEIGKRMEGLLKEFVSRMIAHIKDTFDDVAK
ncbi:purine nucleoside phosphorylase-like [Phymastichus coffea]|uniref:purine nucleoside phosphorylase-like n=1 Tax=Phymastichus coffea TaxID=108790 RepID=UPI00273B543F|nr:purine nucleoside phosphorylase-like [Phymastichus coffea]